MKNKNKLTDQIYLSKGNQDQFMIETYRLQTLQKIKEDLPKED